MAMGGGVRHATGSLSLSEIFGHPIRTLSVAVLLIVLAPLVTALVFMIGYITALVMTIGLAAGLGIVLWVT